MEERIISLIEAQQWLESLPEHFSETCPAMIITCNNQPMFSIMPYGTYQALLENIASLQTILEIMAGQTVGITSKTSKKRIACTHSISWEEFQKEVGWE